MRLWNPYAFGVTGAPNGPQTPAALRVMDGTATAQQLAFAQQAFYRFSDLARCSTVANPVQSGQLPDGSRFKISVVGNSAIMQLWVEEGEEIRESGISFTLSNLDGSLIPVHTDGDGDPIIYLLTPKEKPNTRIASGRWMVRKRKFVQGGKVVNPGKTGLLYYAAIPGAPDAAMPVFRDFTLGINGQAYAYEDHIPNEPLWWNSKQSGRSLTASTPIPFLHIDQAGVQHAMQLDVQLEYVPEEDRNRYFLYLYAGKFRESIDGPIGDLVGVEKLLTTIRYRTITFSADGRKARALGMSNSAFVYLDINISTTGTSTSIHSIAEDGAGNLKGVYYDVTVDQNTTVVGDGGPGTVTTTDRVTEQGPGNSTPVDITASQPTGPVTGSYTWSASNLRSRTFSRRGQPMDNPPRADRTVFAGSNRETIREVSTVIDNDGANTSLVVTTYDQSASSFTNGVKTFESALSYTSTRYSPRYSNLPPVKITLEQGYRWSESSGQSVIFDDDELDFVVLRIGATLRAYVESIITQDQDGNDQIDNGPETITTMAPARIQVRCKGTVLLDTPFDEEGLYNPVVFVASDPMTGALVVSVQERRNTLVKSSWIFVVDDTGAKFLREVMNNVTVGSNIKVRSNASLISV